MTDFRNQVLPVIDPASPDAVLALKNRVVVHEKGMWHPTVQAYIITGSEGSTQTLVQKRSNTVDIGKSKYDQSIAIHIQQNETPEQALERGLLEELNIKLSNYIHTRLLSKFRLFITKTYKEDFSIFNRELVHLFVVFLPSTKDLKICSKIDSYFWTNWSEYVEMTKKEPESFTKTSRYYILNGLLLREIESEIGCTKKIDELKSASTKMNEFNSVFHYLSLFDETRGVDVDSLVQKNEIDESSFNNLLTYDRDNLIKYL
jgi:8-oxo-dGTP pyrophosphatase MutT (NUDIX family)